jgi:hypothetical protein
VTILDCGSQIIFGRRGRTPLVFLATLIVSWVSRPRSRAHKDKGPWSACRSKVRRRLHQPVTALCGLRQCVT